MKRIDKLLEENILEEIIFIDKKSEWNDIAEKMRRCESLLRSAKLWICFTRCVRDVKRLLCRVETCI